MVGIFETTSSENIIKSQDEPLMNYHTKNKEPNIEMNVKVCPN